ncbi:MAG TPA: hypothetical protein VGD52_09000 [Pseudoduganella sp.]
MTETPAGSNEQQPPPPSESGAEPHAHADQPSGARLVEWQAPVFWMSCGALLAGLVGGAVVLVQRVGIERDLMAVATTLPPAAPATAAAALPRHEPAGPVPAPASKPGPADLEGPSVQEPDTQKTVTTPRRNARTTSAVAKPAPRHAAAKQPARKKTAARRKLAASMDKYSEVFKRCPWPGEPGAVECRRHICNGAESEGPACRPYRSKLR